MAKRNAYLAKMQLQKDAAVLQATRFTRQLMVDMAMIALNDEFGFGPERLERFARCIEKVYDHYATTWNNDDPDTVYARAKIDRRLEQACGEKFIPWEERY